jgi:nitroreductase
MFYLDREAEVLATSKSKDYNQALDWLIESRRSIRKFKLDTIPRQLVEQIIRAGLLAPYSGLAVFRDDFRRFVVIPRQSKSTVQIADLLKHRISNLCKQLETQMEQNTFTKEHGQAFLQNLKTMSQHGIPNLGKAPYYIVVAEQRGIPPVEQRSLAHCMQNMWLKATALGVGFQLLSITAQMAKDKEFCNLLNIPSGQFALDGCLIGIADMIPSPSRRPRPDEVTKWID